MKKRLDFGENPVPDPDKRRFLKEFYYWGNGSSSIFMGSATVRK